MVALTLMVVFVHVTVFDAADVTTGVVVLCVIAVLAVFVQPFVAVTVKL